MKVELSVRIETWTVVSYGRYGMCICVTFIFVLYIVPKLQIYLHIHPIPKFCKVE